MENRKKLGLLLLLGALLFSLSACSASGSTSSEKTVPSPAQTAAAAPDKGSSTQVQEGNTFYVKAGSQVFPAVFANNTSAQALKKLLEKGTITLNLEDYGHFEKVGPLGTELPRNDTKITTEPGDVILYQGNKITIYYDQNTWDFTRLGKIPGVTKDQLLQAFGTGKVQVTLSLTRP